MRPEEGAPSPAELLQAMPGKFMRGIPRSPGISETGVRERVIIHAGDPSRSRKTRSQSLKFPFLSHHPGPLQGCHIAVVVVVLK